MVKKTSSTARVALAPKHITADVITKKEKSRVKEHRRAQNINEAFETLQERIPYLKPEERKQLPKIKTLRLAMQYINHLKQLIDGNQMHQSECDTEVRPLQHKDFRSTVASEMRVRNSYRERAHEQEMDQATVRRILAREEQRTRRYCMDDMDGHSSSQSSSLSPENCYNFRQISANEYNRMQNQMPVSTSSNTSPNGYYHIPPHNYHNYENTYSYQ